MTGPIVSIRRAEIPEKGLQLELLWDATLLEQLPEHSSSPDIEGPLRLKVRLRTDGPEVVLKGTCEVRGTMVCVRCLERFSHALSLSFRCVFQPVGMEDASENARLDPGEIDIVFYDGEHIDLIAPVFEQIHLGLPAYPRCSPECRGLCAQCGANLNKAICTCETVTRPQSPFAQLARLKKRP